MRFNKGNLLSLLLSMSFLAVSILIYATPACASSKNDPVSIPGTGDLSESKSIYFPPASGYEVLSLPVVSDNAAGAMGTIKLSVPEGQLKDGDIVFFRLPDGLIWSSSMPEKENIPMTGSDWAQFSSLNGNAYGQRVGNYILVPQTFSGDANALYDVELEVTMLSEKEIKVQIIGEPSPQHDAYMYIYPKHVWVEKGYYGPVNLVADAPLTSGFPDGMITIAYVSVIGGTVSINVTGVDTFREKIEITLRVTEEAHGCLIAKNESVKLELPSGFSWSDAHSIATIWGDKEYVDSFITIRTNENELIMDVGGVSKNATSIEFKVTINAANKVFARPGVVIVKASGDSNVSPARLWVGEYNPYDLNGDKTTNILDLILVNHLISQAPVGENEKADVNYDGRIDILDLLTVAQNIF